VAVESAATGPISIGDSNRLLLAFEEVTSSLKQSPAVERILNTLVAQAKGLAGAAAGRVLLFEGTHGGDQAVDSSAGEGADELRGVRVRAGEGIAVLVSEGEALLLRDPSAHVRYAPPCDQMPTSPGFVCVPLRHGAVRGALLVAGREPDGFEAPAKDLLVRLAHHSAVALDSAVSASRSLDAFTHASEILLSFLERTDARYPDHSRSVAAFADGVATTLGLGEEALLPIHFAALLHDIGKVRVDPALLNASRELSDAERELVQEHVILGVQLLAPISPYKEIPEIIHAHHERWDGQGYPRRLAGEQIPIGARIVAVADAFDAMTRPGSGLTPEEAMSAIEGQAGGQFDPGVARVFVAGQRERLARLTK
jgi:putative nucleotidyltransferase with HDIG domain